MTTGAETPETLLAETLRSWTQEGASHDKTENRSSSAGIPLPPSYEHVDIENPGTYPYTRGINDRGYHDQFWVMGQYSGYASPRETNARFKRLIEAGQTGLSIALDLPTQLGYDSDSALASGEVGKVGVPLDTVDDMVALLHGLPLDRIRQIRTSANAIGPIFAAFMLVALDELDSDPKSFRLMIQNDPLKEFSSRGAYIFPPASSLTFAADVIEYFAENLPHWEPIEFCGYHVRDSGGTAVQEVAIATANGIAYFDEAVRRGVDVTTFAKSLFIFLSSSVDIFEETAKLRAARRIWARLLHERYGVPKESAGINLFVYTLGGALTAQEPLNNAVRVTFEALAAVFGGAQTLATSSFDEALGLPSEAAAHLSLRTQQLIAYESGATKVVDPLAGSYYVEDLTNRIEREILEKVADIAEQGGAVATLESGLISAEIEESAYEFQREIESGDRPVVGVNIFRQEAEGINEVFQVPTEIHENQLKALAGVKQGRDASKVEASLNAVTEAAKSGKNTIPALIDATRARATMGELVGALEAVYGRHRAAARTMA